MAGGGCRGRGGWNAVAGLSAADIAGLGDKPLIFRPSGQERPGERVESLSVQNGRVLQKAPERNLDASPHGTEAHRMNKQREGTAMRRMILVAVAAVWLLPLRAFAQNADQDSSGSDFTDSPMFHEVGLSVDNNITAKTCLVTTSLDEQDFLGSIPKLKDAGLMNPDLSQTAINMIPDGLSMAFLVEMSALIVKQTYATHSDIKDCSFKQVIKTVDEYGNVKDRPAFYFGFNRATYQKVNWDKFDTKNLPKIASHFHIDPGFAAAVEKEAGQ